jgi:hypothetical protein
VGVVVEDKTIKGGVSDESTFHRERVLERPKEADERLHWLFGEKTKGAFYLVNGYVTAKGNSEEAVVL